MIQGDKLNCPSCRRGHSIDNERTEPARCTRCDCELEALIVIRTTARSRTHSAWQAIHISDYRLAEDLSNKAWQLFAESETAECGLVASILGRNNGTIHKWSVRLKNSSSPA